jgi:predicted phage terminase large subunit-like protein
MEFETRFPCVTQWGSDKRTEEGELLNPERFPREEVDALKRSLGSRGSAAQLQQRPTPAGGSVFKESWFQFWGHPASPFPELPKRGTKLQAWDFAFKGKPTGGKKRSYTCGECWLNAAPNFFLVDQERDQVEFVGALRLLYRLSARWPDAHRKLIEDAANGPAIHSVAARKLTGLKLVSPGGGSEARAQAMSVYFESGNVWLPHPSIAPWIEDYIAELLAFPNGANDDQVDCTTHALMDMSAGVGALYAKAMAELGTK